MPKNTSAEILKRWQEMDGLLGDFHGEGLHVPTFARRRESALFSPGKSGVSSIRSLERALAADDLLTDGAEHVWL